MENAGSRFGWDGFKINSENTTPWTDPRWIILQNNSWYISTRLSAIEHHIYRPKFYSWNLSLPFVTDPSLLDENTLVAAGTYPGKSVQQKKECFSAYRQRQKQVLELKTISRLSPFGRRKKGATFRISTAKACPSPQTVPQLRLQYKRPASSGRRSSGVTGQGVPKPTPGIRICNVRLIYVWKISDCLTHLTFRSLQLAA